MLPYFYYSLGEHQFGFAFPVAVESIPPFVGKNSLRLPNNKPIIEGITAQDIQNVNDRIARTNTITAYYITK
jgi:hypothetical protein